MSKKTARIITIRVEDIFLTSPPDTEAIIQYLRENVLWRVELIATATTPTEETAK